MKVGILLILGVVGLWNVFTVFLSTWGIMQRGTPEIEVRAIAIATVFTAIIAWFLFGTEYIMGFPFSEALGKVLRGMWVVVLLYDLGCSSAGAYKFLMNETLVGGQFIFWILLTGMTAGAPVAFSYVKTRM